MTSAEPQAPQFSQDTDAQAGCPAPGIDPHKLNFLAGGGELGSLIREHDWAATPLGPPAAWPQSLKTAVRIMLTSRQPIWIGWGADLIYLYNDAYRSIIGGKHPWALGCPTCDVWRELWPDIGPMLATAMEGIEGTYVEDQLLIMERNGYPEETYYTFSYSPIPDDNGAPGGIICANTDDTQRVIGERQVALLRDLATGVVNARSWADACACSVQALAQGQHDLPFSLLYMVDPATQALALVQQHGFTGGAPAAAQSPPAMWRLDGVLKDQQPRLLDDLPPDLAASLAPGVWGKPARHAAALAITAKGHSARAGVLVVGLNPYRLFDESYRGFLSLVAGQIAAALASADAYDEERRRNEALAELDRAKTAFFANVSHEFRTPLTLMLGPLEDMLASPEPAPSVREHIELAHRNGIRLLRLVNTLLDFSRMEAGRVQAHFEPTDLAIFSAEIASSFRSAIEKAGLQFRLEMQPLPEPVFIDREMWEKVLLNLLSNALKFTFDGAIGVRVAADAGGRSALVVISDTGTGIAAAELPRLFERFHRIEGARSRSFEGSGIGLALVQELVKLHGGDIVAESQPGRGTQFTVRLPFGHAHLPADRVLRTQGADGVRRTQGADGVRRTQGADGVLRTQGADGRAIPMRAHEYVDEALRWLPAAATEWHGLSQMASSPLGGTPAAGPLPGAGKTVLLADDNADMRGYVCRLLETQGYTVVPVGNGEAALSAARDAPPDLVLTDVMMPGLDGFGLLRAIRTDPALASVPVIVLSARAGEEAKLEGLQAGADDYLIKPFGARELLARVNANIQMSHIRREASRAIFQSEQKVLMSEDRLSLALSTGRVSIFEWEVESDRVAVLGPMAEAFGIEREAAAHAGLPLSAFMQGIHADDRSLVAAAIERSVAAGAPYQAEYRLHGGGEDRFVIARGQVGVSADGGKRLAGALMDITERLAAQRALQENQAALEDQTRALQTLNRAAAAIAGDLDLQRLAQTITDAGVEITGADRGAFFYYAADHENEPRQVYATQGAAGFIDLELHAGAPGSAVFAGVTRYQDITENPGCLQEHAPRRVRSYLAVPVRSRGGAVLGGLALGHAQAGMFGDLAQQRVVGLASQAAVAMDNARLFAAAGRELERRRRAERELQSLNANLEERIATEVAERARAEDALRQAQKMEAVGQLTGGVAHDFNNLLTIIMGGLDTIRRSRPGDDVRVKRAVDMAWLGAQRAAGLTSRLLAFSRRQPLEPKPLDINVLVRDMTELLHRTLGEQIELEGVLSPRLWVVEADQNQLESALINLAVNARDAMPEGGKLTIETSNTSLDESYAATDAEVVPGQYVAIAVSDTGEGMSKETLSRVFEPFFTTKEVGRGTGLGLSMVYGFAKQSGGHVTIYSEIGQGTTVKLYFPRHHGGTGAPEAPQNEPVPRASEGEVILVVEDNDDVRAYSVMILRELGYCVVEAGEADRALAVLQSDQRVDLLFTDVVLPGKSGRVLADACAKLRPGLNVLFTTGYSRNAIVHHGRLDPGVQLLTKPFTYEQLAIRIRDMIDRRAG